MDAKKLQLAIETKMLYGNEINALKIVGPSHSHSINTNDFYIPESNRYFDNWTRKATPMATKAFVATIGITESGTERYSEGRIVQHIELRVSAETLEELRAKIVGHVDLVDGK